MCPEARILVNLRVSDGITEILLTTDPESCGADLVPRTPLKTETSWVVLSTEVILKISLSNWIKFPFVNPFVSVRFNVVPVVVMPADDVVV